jgi:hypothetical protein
VCFDNVIQFKNWVFFQNKGDVKIIVGKTYEKLVLKSTKNVLLLVRGLPFIMLFLKSWNFFCVSLYNFVIDKGNVQTRFFEISFDLVALDAIYGK